MCKGFLQVGADINVMASNMWQASSLPFVAGLGPRKAQSLLQAVQTQECALNRVSLWKEIWKPGNVVFRCCQALKYACLSISLWTFLQAVSCCCLVPNGKISIRAAAF